MPTRPAPAQLILFGGSGAILVAALAIFTLLQVPWLGVDFTAEKGQAGIVVAAVAAGPAQGRLNPGDRVVAFETADGAVIRVGPLTLVDESNALKTYTDYRRFLDEQRVLSAALKSGSIDAVLENGSRATITTGERPLASLPFLFWFQLLCGLTAFAIGLAVFSARKRDVVSAIFLVSGIGVLTFTNAAVYTSRELALDASMMETLLSINYLGSYLFGCSLPALLWNYPVPPAYRGGTALWYVGCLLIWGLHEAEVLPGPLQTFNLGAVPIFVAVLYFARRQWRASRGMATERATLGWILRPMLLCCLSYLLLYMVPVALDRQPVMPESASYGLKLLMYIGFAIGITRFRLFELERWWFEIWAWVAGGLAVVLLDGILLLSLDLDKSSALAIALLVAGWGYFPIRQRLWQRFGPAAGRSLEHCLPLLIDTLFRARTDDELDRGWRALLDQAFLPVGSRSLETALSEPGVAQDGLALQIPGIGGSGGVELICAKKGARLFTLEDARFARVMLTLGRQAAALRSAQEQGAHEERRRIMRDLHDDLGAKLLSLVYLARDPQQEELTRSAIQDLRDVLATMEAEPCSLGEVLGGWRRELETRTEAAGVKLVFEVADGTDSSRTLSARAQANLSRIIREAVSNALRHARPGVIHFEARQSPEAMHLTIRDDGAAGDVNAWSQDSESRGCRVDIVIPLESQGIERGA